LKLALRLLFPLALLALGWPFKVVGHPFYVSVCQIDFNSENRTLEIAVKIFTDDFELALEETTDRKFFLGTPRELKEADELIKAYFEDHLKISLNKSEVELNYLGKEVEIDATWCYIESQTMPSSTLQGTITVTNRILLESFEDQSNIVHINAGGKSKSLLLNRIQVTDSVEL
jgi:hypothetical protein